MGKTSLTPGLLIIMQSYMHYKTEAVFKEHRPSLATHPSSLQTRKKKNKKTHTHTHTRAYTLPVLNALMARSPLALPSKLIVR